MLEEINHQSQHFSVWLY